MHNHLAMVSINKKMRNFVFKKSLVVTGVVKSQQKKTFHVTNDTVEGEPLEQRESQSDPIGKREVSFDFEPINKKMRNYVSKKSRVVAGVVKSQQKKTFHVTDDTEREPLEQRDPQSDPIGKKKVSFDFEPHHSTHNFKSERERKKWEEKLFKVKPYGYYPTNTCMSEKEIHNEMLKSSTSVEHCTSSFSGSSLDSSKDKLSDCISCSEMFNHFDVEKPSHNDGRIGSFLVEVLGCVRLPKPNTFVYLLCGDSAFATDVIPSCSSPKWPCRSRRAALFPIYHAFARLCVGVFNVEEKKTVNDKFAGRVMLDLAMLKPNTVYDVTLPLKESANVYSRKPRYDFYFNFSLHSTYNIMPFCTTRGVIRLRFHLHWCNERSAITSYLQRPFSQNRNISIPCADAKTFRNVAFTLYGRHLPGKYSNSSFRATIREMDLYKLQMKYLVIKLLLSFIFWENAYISGYILISWMVTIYFSAISMVPCIFVGLVILLLFNNYNTYIANNIENGGYVTLNLTELFLSLTIGARNQNDICAMEPLHVRKKVTLKTSSYSSQQEHHRLSSLTFSDLFDELLDHAEFPFSEKNTYQKAPVTYSLYSKKSHNDRLSERELNRLSIYPKSMKMNTTMADSVSASNEVDESEDDEYSSSDEDYDESFQTTRDLQSTSLSSLACQCMASKMQSIPVGPEQNLDIRSQSRPFKITLKKLERFTNNMTFGLFDDVNLHVVDESSSSNIHPDELLRTNSSPGTGLPVQRMITKLKSEYQGPVMRIINTGLVTTRIVVNVFLWKDPILSFWFLLFLMFLMFVLAIFPWREFMLLVGFLCFGPQNILLKKKILKKMLKSSSTTTLSSNGYENIGTTENCKKSNQLTKIDDSKRVFHGQHRSNKNEINSSTSNLTRRVYVPYTPFRRDRFYDWPPSPAFSRATPLNFSYVARDTDEVKKELMESILLDKHGNNHIHSSL